MPDNDPFAGMGGSAFDAPISKSKPKTVQIGLKMNGFIVLTKMTDIIGKFILMTLCKVMNESKSKNVKASARKEETN